MDCDERVPLDLADHTDGFDLCVTDPGMYRLLQHRLLVALLALIFVYARVSPAQKELIVTKLKELGLTVGHADVRQGHQRTMTTVLN
jgi:magnesium-transporting ATPase (P-type)